MPLDPELLKKLIAKKDAAPKRGGGGRRKKVDYNNRSHQMWFSLPHKLIDHEDPVFCGNPDCIDPRSKEYGQVVVDIDGQFVCRFCFFDGWLKTNDQQEQLV